MARVLLVGGGACGRELARELSSGGDAGGGGGGGGHAVRIVTRGGARSAIEAAGAQAWIGDPDRLATLRGALDGVTIACWLLGHVADPAAARELHGPRLEAWLRQCVDSTVRGIVYEAVGGVDSDVLAGGARSVEAACSLHAMPHRVLRDGGVDWPTGARAAIDSLLRDG